MGEHRHNPRALGFKGAAEHKEAIMGLEVDGGAIQRAAEEEEKVFWEDELEHCNTCRFFGPAMKNGGADGEVDLRAAGACRYNPPVLFMMQQPAHPSGLQISGRQVMSPAQMGFMSQFPPVMPGAGCGRHEARGAKK